MTMTTPRHVLVPTVIEEGNRRGDRAFDIYSQLLRERIVFLGQEVDDQVANLIISRMLFLEAQNSEARHLPLHQLPGRGVAYAGMAIYDVMQHVEPDVSTISAWAWACRPPRHDPLSGGAAGEALLPAQRPHHDPPRLGRYPRGRPRTWRSRLREVLLSLTKRMAGDHRLPQRQAGRTGGHRHRPGQKLHDGGRGARDYGIIDDIHQPPDGVCAHREPRPSPRRPGNPNCR